MIPLSINHGEPSKRRTYAVAATMCVVLTTLVACDSPTAPSPDFSGDWDFTFSAHDQRGCPGNAGIVRGCAGSGRLGFAATTPVDATHSYRAACQSCEGAADYGVAEQPLNTTRVTNGVLEFSLAACRFAAPIAEAAPRTVVGTVVCRPNQATDAEVSGDWTMSRR